MTALKTVYCQKANPNDETWNNLLKLIIDDNHFEIIGHHKYLNFVCKEILIDQALTISKLLVNALNPSDEDPIDTATKIFEIESKEKDPWVIKAFLGALSLDKAKFSQRDLLTFITKLSQCGKPQGLALLK